MDAKVSIQESDITLSTILSDMNLPEELRNSIVHANIVLIPSKEHSAGDEYLFPENTYEFFRYLQNNADSNLSTEIAASDDNFRQLQKHSAEIEVATILAQEFVLPLVVSLLGSYLYDAVKRLRKKPEETQVKVTIASENQNQGTRKEIKYEGPVSKIQEELNDAIRTIANE